MQGNTMDRTPPSAIRRRQGSQLVDRPCRDVIATATFEQIVWARLDAMEEVLLQLQHRVDGMANTVASQQYLQAGISTSPLPKGQLTTMQRQHPTATESATRRYYQHVDNLAEDVAKSLDPYREENDGDSQLPASKGAAGCAPQPFATTTSLDHTEPLLSTSSLTPEAQLTPPAPRADIASIARLGMDVKIVSNSLAAAREFLASR